MIATAKPHLAPGTTAPPELGEIQVSTGVTTFTFKLFALATSGPENYRTIQLLSCAGPHTSILALHACLYGGAANPTFRANGGPFEWSKIEHNAAGYVTRKQKLAGCYGWYQMVMLAKTPGLMPVVDDAALWREFKSDRYTTPILRQWVPFLRETLIEGGKLEMLDCFQCRAGLLRVSPEDLDTAVCAGVEFGALEIE